MKRNPLNKIKYFSLFEYHQLFTVDNSVHDPTVDKFRDLSKLVHDWKSELQGVLQVLWNNICSYDHMLLSCHVRVSE